MKRLSTLALLALASVISLAALGCKEDPADVPADPAAEVDAAENDPLADLSPADRAAVLAQKICPVTGEALGSMGAPIKLTIDGRDIFICCEGCEAPLREDPAKYFAILEKPTVADAADDAADEDPAAGDEADVADAATEEAAGGAPAGE